MAQQNHPTKFFLFSTWWETCTLSPKWRMIHNSFFQNEEASNGWVPILHTISRHDPFKKSEQTSLFEFDPVIWSKPSSTLCSMYWLCHGHSCHHSLSFLKYTNYIDTLHWNTTHLCYRLHSFILHITVDPSAHQSKLPHVPQNERIHGVALRRPEGGNYLNMVNMGGGCTVSQVTSARTRSSIH